MGAHPIARGAAGALFPQQLAGTFALGQGKPSPAVLPGVQRAEGIALPVHIENAVHLACQADGGHVRALVQKAVQDLAHPEENTLRVLGPLPGMGAFQKSPRFQGLLSPYGQAGKRNHIDADAGGSQVDANALHRLRPLSLTFIIPAGTRGCQGAQKGPQPALETFSSLDVFSAFGAHQYIPPISPPAAGAAGAGSLISATRLSVVKIVAATEEAFCRAERVTLVGSTMPASIISWNSPVRAL